MSDDFPDIDPDRMPLPLSKRERLCIKLILLAIGFVYPSKYAHQVQAFLDSISKELI